MTEIVSVEAAIQALQAQGNGEKAEQSRAYHKVDRPYLGLGVPQIEVLTDEWRQSCTLDQRLQLAADLWKTNIHEARIAAAKLLTQARIRPDDGAWDLICGWVPEFDAWAIADHVAIAGQKRLIADPSRLDIVAHWTTAEPMWTRRAALVMTLPWAKMNNPKAADLAARDRILGWAAGYVTDKDWFIQKAVAWWVRDLSKHDSARAAEFLESHGDKMKSWARKEAAQYLSVAPQPSDIS